MKNLFSQTRIAALVLIAVLTVGTSSAARRVGIPPGLLPDAQDLEMVELTVMPEVDEETLRAEDLAIELSGVPGPTRFGVVQPVRISPESAGTWETLSDGSRLWRLRIVSSGAQSLSLGLDRFELPKGGSFWIHDHDGAWVQGPYTRDDRNSNGGLWTAVTLGEELVVELHLPAGSSLADIEITSVNHGYRGFADHEGAANTKRGSCNVNVVCPEGNRWADQIRSVARITMAGPGALYLCTAQLLNNTSEDETPYLYTAGHCLYTEFDDPLDPTTLVAYWNYQTATCADRFGGSLSQNQSGSTLIAESWEWVSNNEVRLDFALLLLDTDPDPGFNVFFTGWDARAAAPSSSVAIHHPHADQKSISFDFDPATITTRYENTSPGDGKFLRVGDWDIGTTEGGSSGSCLFDETSGLCVGNLSGGAAACGNNSPDWYGRFHLQFTGEDTPESRLSDWLDPTGSGELYLYGRNPGSTSSSSAWLIPGVASLPGAEGSDWKSQVSVVNSSTSSANAMVYFVAAGEDWPGELLSGPHLIGPMGSLYLDDPLADTNPTAGEMYVTVDTSNTAAFSRTINLNEDGSTFGQGVPGILLNDASLVTEYVLPLVHSSPDRYRTNVGLAQTSSGSYRVSIGIYTSASVLLAEKEYSITSAWRQLDDIFSKLGVGDATVEGGWIRVRLVAKQPAFWTTYATVIDSETNDPTYVSPVVP